MADANAQAARPAPSKPAPQQVVATAQAVPIVNSGSANPPAAAAADAAAQAANRPSRREVQAKKIPIGSFKPVGHFTEPHQVMLPATWDFDDVLSPDFWSFVSPPMAANAAAGSAQDRLGTRVEVHTADHAFFGEVYIKGLRRNAQGQADGAYVVCIGPIVDPETGKACPVDLATGGPWRGRKPVGEAAKAA